MGFSQELIDKLKEAEATGKYFISIACVKKEELPDDLKKYYCAENFPDADIPVILADIQKMFTEKTTTETRVFK